MVIKSSAWLLRIPQSNSHTFLARILQKWYISDTIGKNLARILDFRQTCQILADQTFLADSDVSCKILASQDISCKILGRILQDNVWNLKDILQENVWKTSRLFFSKKTNFKPRICSKWMWMSHKWSRTDSNVTKVIEIWYVYFKTLSFGSCTFAMMVTSDSRLSRALTCEDLDEGATRVYMYNEMKHTSVHPENVQV